MLRKLPDRLGKRLLNRIAEALRAVSAASTQWADALEVDVKTPGDGSLVWFNRRAGRCRRAT